ncbi:hypothetical protein EUX98_g7057 [Antrodiella citrinella]|uniref:VPS9 domain-containing protein n=1 Tax=Antrodiella citrinella TaxID=2447956 RepID=A0A4S4MNB5_9APHY|nr:hypothetical protein EUX98_g7057 [Antrodiella citrinella]
MKLKPAEPVAKYLRSFLGNFAKRTFTVNDQVKLINDFLNFISVRMRESDVWRTASDAEFDNAMEGMEKLVMNRLYDFTFTPQVIRMIPPRPVTSDDLERDEVLSQRIALFAWIEPKHLDVPEGEGSEGFIMFAQQELLKITHYKAPRDKLICILNCCKVIFGLIRHLHKEEGADNFVPILIYIVLKANPDHLLSNVEFINRFRNPAKLQSEAGYYLSSLKTGDTISKPLSAIGRIFNEVLDNAEESLQNLPGPFHQFEQLTSMPQTPVPHPEDGQPSIQTPYKPRIRKANSPLHSPSGSRYGTPDPEETPTRPGAGAPYTNQPLAIGPSQPTGRPLSQHTRIQSLVQSERDLQHLQAPPLHVSRTPTPNLDLAGLQEEIDRVHENAAEAARETLKQIFPSTDVEIVEWVLEANEGDLGKSIEALLEMSSGK